MAGTAESDLDGIRRVIAAYCQLCDDGKFDEWARLYTADATFTVMGQTYTGPADIKAFIEAGMPPELRGKHLCVNSLIDVDDSGSAATARTDFIFVGRGSEGFQITSAGRYHDSFVRDADRWLIRSRRIAFLGED